MQTANRVDIMVAIERMADMMVEISVYWICNRILEVRTRLVKILYFLRFTFLNKCINNKYGIS